MCLLISFHSTSQNYRANNRSNDRKTNRPATRMMNDLGPVVKTQNILCCYQQNLSLSAPHMWSRTKCKCCIFFFFFFFGWLRDFVAGALFEFIVEIEFLASLHNFFVYEITHTFFLGGSIREQIKLDLHFFYCFFFGSSLCLWEISLYLK